MKVSRVVLIVVALHVLVIGGIFIFEGCSRATKAPTPDLADNESPADQAAANAPALPPDTTAQNNLVPAVPATPAAPVTTAAAAPTQPPARSYVVKKGDSLWKIAKSQSISIGELVRANNLTKTSSLKVGQKLQIPSGGKAEPVTTATASVIPTTTSADAGAPAAVAASASDGQMYTVKSGDSLWKIARQQNISVASIKQANNLTSDSLKIGQKLHLPSATTTASAAPSAPAASAGIAASPYAEWREPGTYTENGQTIHVVDIGESPAIIAKKYGVKVDDLMKLNGITDAKRIVVGQKLVVPMQQPAAPAPPAPTVAPAAAIGAPIVSEKQASLGD
ncbi:MAG TPA: LysM peptidoglycan-binding domain-containing protein [Verrucomicrobiae bacterium]|nr:LysM peptidoglycan-binding domain-containing protein [Verrucomicrobiae bacterium]